MHSSDLCFRRNTTSPISSKFGEVDIPVEVTHGVEALEDSLCLLTQGE